ncbi:MAG: hypothetical protein EB053_06485, partial [Chlamydiae bacterium]|nr:hypothetical protein [Chlamydiota bacterium]
MSSPVGGPGGPNQPQPNGNQGFSRFINRIRSAVGEIFNREQRPSRPIPSPAIQLTDEQILANWVQSYSEANFPCRLNIDNLREQAQALVNWSNRHRGQYRSSLDFSGRMTFGLNELPTALFRGYHEIRGDSFYPPTLPDLPDIQRVSLQNCENLSSVGNLNRCERLELANCPVLENLPPLPSCMILVLINCPQLQSIPAVAEGCRIIIRDCPLLPPRPNPAPAAQLPRQSRPIPSSANQLTNEQILADWVQSYSEEDFRCRSGIENRREQAQALVNFSRRPACRLIRQLDLGGRMTFGLDELPIALFQGYHFILGDHYYPQTLPTLSDIRRVTLQNCENLTSVGNLVNCEYFELANCPVLENLPPLPNCRRLVLRDCPQLQSIPDVPESCGIVISNCPLLPPRPYPARAAQIPRPQAPPQLAQPVVHRQNLYQGQIDRAAQGTLQDALSFWSSLLPQGQAQLLSAEDLQLSQADQRLFQIFLNRLQETEDFRPANPQNRQNFALRVANIVRDMAT